MRRTPSLASLLAASAAAALAVPTGTPRAGEVKTLDDINIDGEVRLPRVLFITSRETARPLDFLDLCLPPAEGDALPAGPVPVVGTPSSALPGAAEAAGPDADVAADAIPDGPAATAAAPSMTDRPSSPTDPSEEESR